MRANAQCVGLSMGDMLPCTGAVSQVIKMGGCSDMSPEVHCNLCNHCYTLGMPDPRPDIKCVQYLTKVHYKVPINFLAPSGTSEVID